MGSAIPDYGLYNAQGNQVLSRDRRFAHSWYTAKKLENSDNANSMDDLAGWGSPAQYPDPLMLDGLTAFLPQF